MADSNEVKFLLDLDISEFADGAATAQGMITQIADPDSFAGLLDTLGQVTTVLGVAAVAAGAFVAAIDLSEQAEDIQRVQNEFDNLTTSAGISTKELKDGLEEASGGLIDTNTLLQDANQAIIKMGASASQLPQIMEIAKQATAVYGGDLNTNFNNIANAIGNGNTRMLKQYGIIVDTTAATKAYADANGVAANELSIAGRNQAIMNAALEQAQAKFSGISGSMGETQTSLQLLKTTFTEVKDIFVLAFEKTIGPGLHNFLQTVNDVAGQAKTTFTAMFGDGLAKNQAQITGVQDKLQQLKGELIDLQHTQGQPGLLDRMMNGDKATQIANLNKQIAETTATLNVLEQVNGKLQSQDQQAEQTKQQLLNTNGKLAQASIVDKQKQLADQAEFQAKMLAMNKALTTAEEKNIQSIPQIESQVNQQRFAIQQQYESTIASIEKNESLNRSQKNQLELIAAKTLDQQQASSARDLAALRTQLLNQYVANSTSAFNGIERAAKQMTMQAKAELVDFGKQGQEVMNSFKSSSVNAFETMGASISQGVDVAQAATTAITQLFLGMIGDIAIQDGTRIMLSGVWPPNPLALAGGAALIAFGGALKSLSGSSSSTGAAVTTTPTTTTSASSDGSSTTTANNPSPVPSSAAQTATPQRIVNFNIAGSLFNTSTTQRQLMEMMRQETNATGFTYNTIGV